MLNKINFLLKTILCSLIIFFAACGSWDAGNYDSGHDNTYDSSVEPEPGFYIDGNKIDMEWQNENNIIAEVIAYINSDSESNTDYTVSLSGDITEADEQVINREGVSLTITSREECKISKGGKTGRLFRVGGTLTRPIHARLVVGGRITLEGSEDNTFELVGVYYGGVFELYGYGKITGNTNSNRGGAIYAQGNSENGTVITMRHSALICDNAALGSTATSGGIYMHTSALILYNNASIRENAAQRSGGGVFANNSTIILYGNASICGNLSQENGGGIHIDGSSLTLYDDSSIFYNFAGTGGGVFAANSSLALRDNASIWTNTAQGGSTASEGGGAYITRSQIVLYDKAAVTANTAKSSGNNAFGGGFYMYLSDLTLYDNAVISGNTADSASDLSYGGGIYMAASQFYFTGGSLDGNTLKYKTAGMGGALCVFSGEFIISGNAAVPFSGDITRNEEITTDKRNSIILHSGTTIAISGSLNAAKAGLTDLAGAWTDAKVLVDYNEGSPQNFNGNAPTGKFELGKFIMTANPYTAADIGNSKIWDANGGIADK
ncbi:MAG: hypothetical protein FWG92_01925 [Leptospirales bacterium]|nr:hypothetical protein [Leptospirales bacterium]